MGGDGEAAVVLEGEVVGESRGVAEDEKVRPIIVCLCGSTRFMQTFEDTNRAETLKGKIVLSVGCDLRSAYFSNMSSDTVERIKETLDELHLRKIDLADEILVLNVSGYIGESTRREIDYARANGKRVRFLEGGE
jgi:hypothetical protein